MEGRGREGYGRKGKWKVGKMEGRGKWEVGKMEERGGGRMIVRNVGNSRIRLYSI